MMKYNPNWEEAKERYTALWNGEMLDRPCVDIRAPLDVLTPCVQNPPDAEALWTDPDYRLSVLRRELVGTWYGGEAIPGGMKMLGWLNCLGGDLKFDERTIWFEQGEVDFSKSSPFRHDPQSCWSRQLIRLHDALLDEAGWDDFLVGTPKGLPANDLLAMMMGTEQFLLALIDGPEWMEEAIIAGARDQLSAWKKRMEEVKSRHKFWYGKSSFYALWAPEPFLSTQSDVSCMLSPEAFERFILPEIELYGAEYNALWYHLDGADARQHLPCLLSLPYLRVLQYTPAPNEPPSGRAHLKYYKKVQNAGKIVHIGLPKEDIETVVRHLDPALLVLNTRCDSPEEGRQILESVTKWANAPRRS